MYHSAWHTVDRQSPSRGANFTSNLSLRQRQNKTNILFPLNFITPTLDMKYSAGKDNIYSRPKTRLACLLATDSQQRACGFLNQSSPTDRMRTEIDMVDSSSPKQNWIYSLLTSIQRAINCTLRWPSINRFKEVIWVNEITQCPWAHSRHCVGQWCRRINKTTWKL